MPMVNSFCFSIAILGKKSTFVLWWVDVHNGYWLLSIVCCSKMPVVNKIVWQGGLRKHDDYSRSMREMPRSAHNLLSVSWMLNGWSDGCSIVHRTVTIIITCNPKSTANFYSRDNRNHTSAQCDWGITKQPIRNYY